MVVLDTHVLVWWVNGNGNLSKPAANLIKKQMKSENSLLVSAISAWEVAMLVEKGRLALAIDVITWLEEIKRIPAVQFAPVDTDIAVKSTQLPGSFHNDPADRMIVALARQFSIPLITSDKKIQSYKHVKTIW